MATLQDQFIARFKEKTGRDPEPHEQIAIGKVAFYAKFGRMPGEKELKQIRAGVKYPAATQKANAPAHTTISKSPPPAYKPTTMRAATPQQKARNDAAMNEANADAKRGPFAKAVHNYVEGTVRPTGEYERAAINRVTHPNAPQAQKDQWDRTLADPLKKQAFETHAKAVASLGLQTAGALALGPGLGAAEKFIAPTIAGLGAAKVASGEIRNPVEAIPYAAPLLMEKGLGAVNGAFAETEGKPGLGLTEAGTQNPVRQMLEPPATAQIRSPRINPMAPFNAISDSVKQSQLEQAAAVRPTGAAPLSKPSALFPEAEAAPRPAAPPRIVSSPAVAASLGLNVGDLAPSGNAGMTQPAPGATAKGGSGSTTGGGIVAPAPVTGKAPKFTVQPGYQKTQPKKPAAPVDKDYTGPAIWENGDHAEPVYVTGVAGTQDGETYVNTTTGQGAIPMSDVRHAVPGEIPEDVHAIMTPPEVAAPSPSTVAPAVQPKAKAKTAPEKKATRAQPAPKPWSKKTILYHGTPHTFEGIPNESTAPQWGKGIYFATNPDKPRGDHGHEGHLLEFTADFKKPLYDGSADYDAIVSELERASDKKRAALQDAADAGDDAAERELQNFANFDPSEPEGAQAINAEARKRGYDAIIAEHPEYEQEVVALDPSRLKRRAQPAPKATATAEPEQPAAPQVEAGKPTAAPSETTPKPNGVFHRTPQGFTLERDNGSIYAKEPTGKVMVRYPDTPKHEARAIEYANEDDRERAENNRIGSEVIPPTDESGNPVTPTNPESAEKPQVEAPVSKEGQGAGPPPATPIFRESERAKWGSRPVTIRDDIYPHQTTAHVYLDAADTDPDSIKSGFVRKIATVPVADLTRPSAAPTSTASKEAEAAPQPASKPARTPTLRKGALARQTLADYKESQRSKRPGQQYADQQTDESLERHHRQAVEDAVSRGYKVPPEVLADYPDLVPAPAAAPKSTARFKVGDHVHVDRTYGRPQDHYNGPAVVEEVGKDGLDYHVRLPDGKRLKVASGKMAPAPAAAPSKKHIVSDDEMESLKAAIKAKLGQLNTGIDPELLNLGARYALGLIERGAREWTEYVREMLDAFGEKLRPHLRPWYEAARYSEGLDNEGMTPAAEIDAAPKVEQKAPESVKSSEEATNVQAPGDRGEGKANAGSLAGVSAPSGEGTTRQGNARPGGSESRPEDEQGADRVDGQRDGLLPGGRADEEQVHVHPAGDAGTRIAGPNYVITDDDNLGAGGPRAKYRDNVKAIRLLKRIQADGRPATAGEQAVLVKYVGWGGIPQAFDQHNNDWAAEAQELKDVLTPDEYAAARQSTQYAHYTAPAVVSAMWDAMAHLGFDGGKVLEPSLGTGNFFGLLPATMRGSATSLFGVELDPITGGIATLLYPGAKVSVNGFQDVNIPEGHFDVAIGNPPFSSTTVFDAANKKISGFSLHNYFFAKSIESLRPGGVLAMVVSNSLMDKAGDKQRRYFANQTRLLGAIRLPNDAFKQNAGTEVTTDIIFLQKVAPGQKASGPSWSKVDTIPDPAGGEPIPINEYFAAHPEMMLGDMNRTGSMYRADMPALTSRPGSNLADDLKAAIGRLPASVYGARDEDMAERLSAPEVLVPDGVKVLGMFVAPDGTLHTREGDVLGERTSEPVPNVSPTFAARAKGMIGVRDVLTDLMRSELSGDATDKELSAKRKNLNTVYDRFVREHGYISSAANAGVFVDDPDYPLLQSLEVKYSKGVSKDFAKKHGVEYVAPSAQKADIFTRRVAMPYKKATHADTPQDALTISLSEHGRVNLPRMAELTGMEESAITDALSDVLFNDPVGGWVEKDQYLSGNVKEKLAQAKKAARDNHAFEKNVTALEKVQPKDVPAGEIAIQLGAPWVAPSDIEDFYEHLTGGKATVLYAEGANKWAVRVSSYGDEVKNTVEWGTTSTPLSRTFDKMLNGTPINVYEKDAQGTNRLNKEKTAQANFKAKAVRDEFRNWLFTDAARTKRLAAVYNEKYNTNVERKFDGSHLTFPGKSLAITLRPSQANAIWRIVQNGKALLDHVVGAGKTFTVIGAAIELKRMGLANKPMAVVPNHLVTQWSRDVLTLYPGAKILTATKKDFEKDRRKLLFSRIATGDWDFIVVAHSSFERVGMPVDELRAFIQEQINDIVASIEVMNEDRQGNRKPIKQMEKQKENLENKLREAMDTAKKDDAVGFEQLGVDFLFVDEAHEYKNLGYATSMTRVKGLGNPAGSQKAMDLYVKSRWLQRQNDGTGVVFATGTPVSNSIAEMFTMMRYLDYNGLRRRSIAHFDAWAKLFAVTETRMGPNAANKYVPQTTIAQFENMPEMLHQYFGFADVIANKDLIAQAEAEGKTFPMPLLEGGGPIITVSERTDLQAEYIAQLVQRIEHPNPDPSVDNPLKIMGEARLLALDQRLVIPNAPDDPDSKINKLVVNVYDLWRDTKKDRGTQLVFCDLSAPNNSKTEDRTILRAYAKAEEADPNGDHDWIRYLSKNAMAKYVAGTLSNAVIEAAKVKFDAGDDLPDSASSGDVDAQLAAMSDFSVYDDIKAKLIAMGIPEHEIVFIHDAKTDLQKQALFDKVNAGIVRVLIGSTPKMGAGMNVQERIVGMHHADAPWKPSSLEQRNGRGMRQGNHLYNADPQNFRMREYRYATKGTLDVFFWELIERKAKMVEQLRAGDLNVRTFVNTDGESASAAQMKAASSDDPLQIEAFELEHQIDELKMQESSDRRARIYMRDKLLEGESAEADYKQAVQSIENKHAADLRDTAAARALRDKHPMEDENGKPVFHATMPDGTEIDKHADATKAIEKAIKDANADLALSNAGVKSYPLFTYRGVKATYHAYDTGASVVDFEGLTIPSAFYKVHETPSATGLIQRINNAYDNIHSEAHLETRKADAIKKAAARRDVSIAEAETAKKALENKFQHAEELARLRERHAEVLATLSGQNKKNEPEGEETAQAPHFKKTPIFDKEGKASLVTLTREDAEAIIDRMLGGMSPGEARVDITHQTSDELARALDPDERALYEQGGVRLGGYYTAPEYAGFYTSKGKVVINADDTEGERLSHLVHELYHHVAEFMVDPDDLELMELQMVPWLNSKAGQRWQARGGYGEDDLPKEALAHVAELYILRQPKPIGIPARVWNFVRGVVHFMKMGARLITRSERYSELPPMVQTFLNDIATGRAARNWKENGGMQGIPSRPETLFKKSRGYAIIPNGPSKKALTDTYRAAEALYGKAMDLNLNPLDAAMRKGIAGARKADPDFDAKAAAYEKKMADYEKYRFGVQQDWIQDEAHIMERARDAVMGSRTRTHRQTRKKPGYLAIRKAAIAGVKGKANRTKARDAFDLAVTLMFHYGSVAAFEQRDKLQPKTLQLAAAAAARNRVLDAAARDGLDRQALTKAYSILARGEDQNGRDAADAGLFSDETADKWWGGLHLRLAFRQHEDVDTLAHELAISGRGHEALMLKTRPHGSGTGARTIARATKPRLTDLSQGLPDGAITKPIFLHVQGSGIIARAIAKRNALITAKRLFGKTAKAAERLNNAAGVHAHYVQWPKSLIPKREVVDKETGKRTSVPMWRDYYVPDYIAEKMLQDFDPAQARNVWAKMAHTLASKRATDPGAILTAVDGLTSLWKLGIMPLSVASHMTQWLGNISAAVLHGGMDPVSWPYWLSLGAHHVAGQTPEYHTAAKHLTSLHHGIAEEFGRPQGADDFGGGLAMLQDRAWKAYGTADRAWRVGLFQWRLFMGDTPEEAAVKVEKIMPNYRLDSPPFVNWLASTGITPIVKFYVLYLREGMKNIWKHPQRPAIGLFVPVLLVNALSGIPRAERGAILSTMPVSQRLFTVFVGGRDANGKPQYVNFGKYITVMPNAAIGTGKGIVEDLVRGAVTTVNPAIQGPAEFLTNQDLYSGGTLSKAPSGTMEQTMEKAGKIIGNNVPSFTPGVGRSARAIADSAIGKRGWNNAPPSPLGLTIFNEVTGLKTRSMGMDDVRAEKAADISRTAREFAEQMSAKERDAMKYPPGSAKRQAILDDVRARDKAFGATLRAMERDLSRVPRPGRVSR
jgi:N12 class adenine-specific DNA methylase